MVQKAMRSEASLQNSLGPRRNWLKVRGEVLRPRTALYWLLAIWVMVESEEATVAHCRPVDLRKQRKRK